MTGRCSTALKSLVFASIIASTAAAEGVPVNVNNALLANTSFSDNNLTPVPLSTGVLWTKRIAPDDFPSLTGTSQILSLVMEEDKAQTPNFGAYEWPLFIQLTSNVDTGDQVGSYVREYSTGANWASGYHTETWGGQNGGTKIGYNTEMHKMGTSRMIGIDVHAVQGAGEPAIWSDQAINIQSDSGVGWNDGISFDGTSTNQGIHFQSNSTGTRAIQIEGNYSVGIDVGTAPIRLTAGTPIQLEETGQITVVYNPATSCIEFMNGGQLVFFIPMNKGYLGGAGELKQLSQIAHTAAKP